jgi:hypothetical protein
MRVLQRSWETPILGTTAEAPLKRPETYRRPVGVEADPRHDCRGPVEAT